MMADMSLAQVPDPVAEGKAYQTHILGLLGDDDPVEVQRGTAERYGGLVADAGDLVRTRPEPTEWSVLECLAHTTQAEVVYSARYRWIVAHDEPPLIGYDQDLWVDGLRGNEEDPDRLLGVLRVLREWNLEMWARSTPEERAKVGMHSERGPESYDISFRLIAGHDRFHLAQAEKALRLVREAG
jgi:hypothetical protein